MSGARRTATAVRSRRLRPLSRRPFAGAGPGLVVAVAAFLTAALAGAASLEDAAPGAVVARIDGEAVTVAEVLTHLRPEPPRVGPEPLPDPRRAALEEALQLHLLDREARRREGATAATDSELARARRVRALVEREVERAGLGLEAIDAAAARAAYESDCRRFSKLEEVELALVQTADEAAAEELLRRAATEGLETAAAGREVERLTIDGHGHGAEPAVVRVAVRMREAGEVGLAETADDRFQVLQALRVDAPCAPWSAELEGRVRRLLHAERREAHLDRLAAELRREAEIEVDEALLARLPVPAWDDPEFLY